MAQRRSGSLEDRGADVDEDRQGDDEQDQVKGDRESEHTGYAEEHDDKQRNAHRKPDGEPPELLAKVFLAHLLLDIRGDLLLEPQVGVTGILDGGADISDRDQFRVVDYISVLGGEVDPGVVDAIETGERGLNNAGAGGTDHPADPDGGGALQDAVTGIGDRLLDIGDCGLCGVVVDAGSPGGQVDTGVMDALPGREGTLHVEGAGRTVHPGDLQFRLPLLVRHGDHLTTQR